MKINNPIDEHVLRVLEKKGIAPSEPCTDEVFIRRVYLDLVGTLPTLDESRAFLSQKDPSKRNVLISRLLERKEYAAYWTMKWCDLLRVKSEFPIKLWPNAVQAYSRWIMASMKENKPYDRFSRELLTSGGSNFRTAPVNFYRALPEKTPMKTAETVALTFMGTRLSGWPVKEQKDLSAFFEKIGYKGTAEWKEEIVYFDRSKEFSRPPVFPDGTRPDIGRDTDPREIFTEWLITAENPWFCRNMVNRIWSWMFGRGIIHEPDDIRHDNPPQNPELLAWLEKEFSGNGYDLKHMFRIIAQSSVYQLSARPSENNRDDTENFSRYYVRRLEAEVLIDAICAITHTTEEYHSPIPEPFTFVPWNQRTIMLADGSISSPFLDMFGRPPRDTGYESERSNDTSVFQVLHLLNSRHVLTKIREGAGIKNLVPWNADRNDCIRNIYLTVLSRYPEDPEKDAVAAYMDRNNVPIRDGMNDLAWALINSKEFLYRH